MPKGSQKHELRASPPTWLDNACGSRFPANVFCLVFSLPSRILDAFFEMELGHSIDQFTNKKHHNNMEVKPTMKEISLGSKTCRSKSWQKLHMNHPGPPNTNETKLPKPGTRVSPEFACGGGSPLRSLLGKSTLRRNLGEVEIRHRNTYCTVVGSRNTLRSNSQRLFFFGSSGRNIFCQMLHLFQWVENLLGEANGRKERFLWAFQAISATKKLHMPLPSLSKKVQWHTIILY